jgi:predicted nucleic-acid-binding protein
MKKEQGDMTIEEFSIHMEGFIEEQAQILRADIHTYNKRKALYEDSYTIA